MNNVKHSKIKAGDTGFSGNELIVDQEGDIIIDGLTVRKTTGTIEVRVKGNINAPTIVGC